MPETAVSGSGGLAMIVLEVDVLILVLVVLCQLRFKIHFLKLHWNATLDLCYVSPSQKVVTSCEATVLHPSWEVPQLRRFPENLT